MLVSIQKTPSQSSERSPLRLTLGQPRFALGNAVPVTPLQWDVATVVLQNLLDTVCCRLIQQPQETLQAMEELMSGLWSLKASATAESWQTLVGQCINHPLRQLIHQDPFSFRSFHKPRGYAGDAVLIDFIYSRNCSLGEADVVSPLGQRIFEFNRDTPACAAVRSRRDLVASMIDEVCVLNHLPNILSVACGHMREASLCRSVTGGESGRFVGLDQDEASLQVVRQELSESNVVPVCGSIKEVFRGELARSRFDFIYSTGLYDYLDDRVGSKLTKRLFEMLNPGGRLLVANFLPDTWGVGYMEAFMDWNLIYRSPQQMAKLSGLISDSEVASQKTFIERHANIVFLELIRE